MSILREGQEMFIDPLSPYGNNPAPPIVDFGMHFVINALEIAVFVVVHRIARRERENAPEGALTRPTHQLLHRSHDLDR
jgi:hypothetical protein